LRGRKPTPTPLKILRNNPGRRPLNAREPKPRAGVPTAPDWMSAEAKAEWKRIVPELRALRLLTLVDRAGLVAYCQAYAELQICTRKLNEEGRTIQEPILGDDVVEGKKLKTVVGAKVKKHPLVSAQRDAFARVRAFIAEFGLSPASRSRVNTIGGGDEDKDPLQELFDRAKGKRA
jgi:P27 family predicted phage terminase small subunit